LGESKNRVRIELRARPGASKSSGVLSDGMACELVSMEDLNARNQRCDVLMAYTNPYLYYYYNDYDRPYQQWALSNVVGGGPLKAGAELRLISRGDGQFTAPKGDYLTTVKEESPDCVWVLEKAYQSEAREDRRRRAPRARS